MVSCMNFFVAFQIGFSPALPHPQVRFDSFFRQIKSFFVAPRAPLRTENLYMPAPQPLTKLLFLQRSIETSA